MSVWSMRHELLMGAASMHLQNVLPLASLKVVALPERQTGDMHYFAQAHEHFHLVDYKRDLMI